MSEQAGRFVWFELHTPDPDAAAAFYAAVIGWRAEAFGSGTEPAGDYRIFHTEDGEGVAGLMAAQGPAAGLPAGWFGYVGTPDPDGAAARASELGGTVHVPPTDIPGVGRFAFLADPQGALFYVMRGDSPRPSPSFRPGAAGHGSWAELTAPDQDVAIAFYGALFGWRKDGGMPMGAMGDYSFLKRADAGADEAAFGAAMNAADGAPVGWRYYFALDDVAAAARRIEDAGGQVLYGPAEVPGGSHIVIAADPQGAAFGLVGSREAAA